jgi:hypothetical protein
MPVGKQSCLAELGGSTEKTPGDDEEQHAVKETNGQTDKKSQQRPRCAHQGPEEFEGAVKQALVEPCQTGMAEVLGTGTTVGLVDLKPLPEVPGSRKVQCSKPQDGGDHPRSVRKV